MARNQTSSSAAPASIPEGFRRLGSVANAGWFNMKKVGNTLHGVLEGMYERNDTLNPKGKSKFFQVKLLADCEVRMGRGEDAAIVQAKAGEYVNLNYGPKTRDLESLTAQMMQGAQFQIMGIVAGDKIKLTGGRSMHNFDVGIKMTKAPQAPDEDIPDLDGSDGDDDAATA